MSGSGALAEQMVPHSSGQDSLLSPPPQSPGHQGLTTPCSAADTARAVALEIAASPARGARPPSPHLVREARVAPYTGGGYSGGASVRVSSEAGMSTSSKLLGMVRSEMASMEAQLHEEMKRFQDVLVERQAKIREAELQRLEKKLLEQASVQGKLDRRISELSGMFRGLHSEVQLQIQGGDAMDKRLAELRHSMEEELRQRCQELEGSHSETLHKCRGAAAAGEDTLKRHGHSIRRLETALQELFKKGDLHAHQAAMHHERLELLEATPNRRHGVAPTLDQESSSRLWQLEHTVGDITQQLEQLTGDVSGDRETYHAMAAQLQEYDTRIMACRSKVDRHHEVVTSLDEHIKQICEERCEAVQKGLQEVRSKVFQVSERYEAVRAFVDDFQSGAMALPHQALHSQAPYGGSFGASQELALDWRQPSAIADRTQEPRGGVRGVTSGAHGLADPSSTVAPPPRPRAQHSGSSEGEVAEARSPGSAGASDAQPQLLGRLLEQLRDLAPKVIDHQKAIDDHRTSIEQLGPGAEAGLASVELVGGLRDEVRGLRSRVTDVEERLGSMPDRMGLSTCLDNSGSPAIGSLLPAAELRHAAEPVASRGPAEVGLRGLLGGGAPGVDSAASTHQALVKRIANMDRLMGLSPSAGDKFGGPLRGSGGPS